MEKYSLGIKKWAVEDRPREKLMNKGVHALSDSELLAIIIGTGTRNASAVDLAREILSEVNNNLFELGKLSIAEMQKRFKGIGKAKAISIAAAIEIGKRHASTTHNPLPKITSSDDAFKQIRPVLSGLNHEEFWTLFMDRSNRVIGKEKSSQGGISSTIFDVRLILKSAIEKLASSIIICHNHPSGNTMPSNNDKQITYKMQEASKLMDIQLLDHIIVCGNTYYSFADEKLI